MSNTQRSSSRGGLRVKIPILLILATATHGACAAPATSTDSVRENTSTIAQPGTMTVSAQKISTTAEGDWTLSGHVTVKASAKQQFSLTATELWTQDNKMTARGAVRIVHTAATLLPSGAAAPSRRGV
jgi:hypothetical protein